ASTLREHSKLPSGTEIAPAPRYFVGVADSPLVEHYDPARLEVKLDAGAGFERTAVFVGVAPLRSARQARYMNERLPGVHVPDSLLRALEDAGPEAEALGTAQCVQIVSGLRAMQGISGVHVIGLG